MTSIKSDTAPCNICLQNAESRRKAISDLAYQIFLQKGSPPGQMKENWYEAEVELTFAQGHSQPMPCGCGYNASAEHAS